MDVVVALHAAAALLLLVAGMAKIVRPAPTAELLSSLGVPAHSSVAITLGVVECAVGIAALAVGGPLTALATAAFYIGFTGVVGRALAVGAVSCGCFGRADTPPSWLHVVGNTGFAAASIVAVAGDTPLDVMDDQPAAGLGFVVGVGVIAGLALVAFTALPEALAARRPSTPSFRVDGGDGTAR